MLSFKRAVDKLVSALFMIILLLPASYYILGKREVFSTTEQRTLAAWPRFDEGLRNLVNITIALDSYFNDHLLFRSKLIKLHNLVKYFVFNQSPSSAVRLGQDDFLFYGGEVRYPRKLNPLEIELMYKALSRKQEFLKQNGIEYLFVAVPDKAAIYSEFLPTRFKKKDYQVRLKAVEKYLNDRNPGLVLNLQPVLLAKKNEDRIYFKTDSHWNYLGAYFGYQHILEYLEPKFEDFKPLPRSYFDLKVSKRGNLDLSRMMALGQYLEEESYFRPTSYKACSSQKLPIEDYLPRGDYSLAPVAYECPQKKIKDIIIYRFIWRFAGSLFERTCSKASGYLWNPIPVATKKNSRGRAPQFGS